MQPCLPGPIISPLIAMCVTLNGAHTCLFFLLLAVRRAVASCASGKKAAVNVLHASLWAWKPVSLGADLSRTVGQMLDHFFFLLEMAWLLLDGDLLKRGWGWRERTGSRGVEGPAAHRLVRALGL